MHHDFEEIYHKYYDDIYRYVYSYTLNKCDTEDIVQKTFLKLYNNIFKLENEEHTKRWLLTVASNECTNFFKSFWKRNVTHYNKLDFTSESIDNNESYELYELLNGLDYKYRLPLFLFYFEGYSIKDISLILRKSENCIKQRLKRGKEFLKIELEK